MNELQKKENLLKAWRKELKTNRNGLKYLAQGAINALRIEIQIEKDRINEQAKQQPGLKTPTK